MITAFRTLWSTFIFLTRSFLGNSDFSVAYQQAPILGSFLIVLYVLLMIFVIVNLFYAIMIRALADVKEEEGFSKGRQWEQTKEKATVVWDTLKSQLRLEERFRSCFPGLHGRMVL